MRGVAVALAVVFVVALALLVAVEAGVPVAGISHGDAIAVALAQARVGSSTPPQVAWAFPGLFGFFRGGSTDAVSPWSRRVWAVRLSGTYQGSCPPSGTRSQLRCPVDHTETVILDYVSGEFIMASIEP